MKLNIDKIGFALILVIIVLSNIYIGANVKEPIWFLQAIITIFTAIYIIIKKKDKQKNILIKNKIDVVVILFITSTFIPFMLKKHITLDGAVGGILKYFSVYGFYVLIRNVVNTEKRKNIVFNTFIICSIIPIIFGYDILFFNNIFSKIYYFIDLIQTETTDRMISTFAYANTFAVYLSVMSIFAFMMIKKTSNKKIKIIYYFYIIIALITIALTQSKAVIAIDVFIGFVYILNNLKNNKISKKWIIVGVALIIAFVLYYFIAIQFDKPLVNDNTVESNKVIRGIEPNKEYNFEFNLTAEAENKFEEFQINIVEVSRYLTEDIIYTWKFSNFDGVENLSFKTSDTVDHIIVRIKNKYNNKITINELKINGEKYILKYKYIPEQLIRVFKTFNSKNSSVWQRGDYYYDSLKIIANYTELIGGGGNAWEMYYGLVQDYLYYSRECHSYIFDIAISYGVLGITLYILLIALVILEIKKIYQNKDYEKLFLMIAFITMFLHSVMDFDFSFFIIQILFFMIIAFITNREIEINEQKYIQIVDYLMIIVFMIVSTYNIFGTAANIVEKSKKQSYTECHNIAPWAARYHYNQILYNFNKKEYNKQNILDIKEYIKNEPFRCQNEIYKIYVKNLLENFSVEDTEYIIDVWKKYPVGYRYDVDRIIIRSDVMIELAEKIEELGYHKLAKGICQIIVEESNENIDIFAEYKRNGKTSTMIKFKFDNYISNVEKAMNILKQE